MHIINAEKIKSMIKVSINHLGLGWLFIDKRRKELTHRHTHLIEPALEDSHCLSFSRTHKELLLCPILDKAAYQCLKQKQAKE
jgi:hypothetical protein